MSNAHTMLAATDFSAPARRAVLRAGLLAQQTGSPLELLHVVSQSALDELRNLLGQQAPAIEPRLMDDVREQLQQLSAELQQRYQLQAATHLGTGSVLVEIAQRADVLDAGLLIVGARGTGFLRHLLLGSTAERLLRKTMRPLLVVKETPHEPYRRVLVPVDFSAWSASALHLARRLAPQASLVLLHAYDVPFEAKLRFAGVDDTAIHHYRDLAQHEARQRMAEFIVAAGVDPATVNCELACGAAATVIVEQQVQRDIDLIVIGKHGQSVLEELLLGSVTKHVLADAACDILVASRSAG